MCGGTTELKQEKVSKVEILKFVPLTLGGIENHSKLDNLFFRLFFFGQPIIMNFCMDNLRTIEQLLGLISGRSTYRVKYGGQPKLNLIFEANALHARLYHQVKHF